MHNIVLAGENFEQNFSEKEELALLLVICRIALSPKGQCELEDRIQVYIITFEHRKLE